MPQSESKHSFFLQIKFCGSIHFKDWRATPPVSHDAIILNYRFRDGFLFYMSLFLLFLRFGIQYRTKGMLWSSKMSLIVIGQNILFLFLWDNKTLVTGRSL